MLRITHPLTWLFSIGLLLCQSWAHANYGVHGYIYTQGVVEDAEGTRFWAEYNVEDGSIESHFAATGAYSLESVTLMNGTRYRQYLTQWQNIKGDYPQDNQPVNYHLQDLISETFYVLPQGEEAPVAFSFFSSDFSDSVRNVIIRPPAATGTNGEKQYVPVFNLDDGLDISALKRQIILAEMPINPDEPIPQSTVSLLLATDPAPTNPRVVKQSEHNIGFLTSFIDGVEGALEYDGKDYSEVKYGIQRGDSTEFTNPIQGAVVKMMGGNAFEMIDVTGREGRYSLFFAGWMGGPPCWIMTDMYSPLIIEMQSRSFNPRMRGTYPFYMLMDNWLPCNPAHPLTIARASSLATSLSGAMAAVNLIAIAAASPIFIHRIDHIIDMKILAGKAEVSNEHLSIDAITSEYLPNQMNNLGVNGEKRSDVFDLSTQNQWSSSGWDKSISVSDDTTEYQVDPPEDADYKMVQSRYDFDGDGNEDTAVIGQFNCVTTAEDGTTTDRLVNRSTECESTETRDFKIHTDATNAAKIAKSDLNAANNTNPPSPYYQGVYFSSALEEGTAPTGMPDVIRLLDDVLNDHHQGLLKVIARQDLINTDVYVFRESTGDLLAERSGLANRDLEPESGQDEANVGVGEGASEFHYRIQLRGKFAGRNRVGRYGNRGGYRTDWDEAFQRWQTISGMNPKFYEREADHIRPGEPVRVIIINRATGYIGSARTVTLPKDDTVTAIPSVRIPPIKLGPPNLKIWAEREFTVEHGLTQGEKREYLIGSEGAAETDDLLIKVYTEWLDQDGSPLPADLKEFGYTARLGKLTGANTITDYGNTGGQFETEQGEVVRYFPINPGKNLQLIRVSEANAGTQHLYVQVNGEAYIRNPDFSGDPAINIELNQAGNRQDSDSAFNFTDLGAGPDQLLYRPKHFVPVLTPVWDEDSTLENKLYFKKWEIAQEAAEANGTATPGETNPYKPEPAYKWRYRPEFQFTVYDLNVKDIQRVNLNESGEEVTQSIIEADMPLIGSTDDLIRFIYDLSDQVANPISLFSGDEKQLIFALGEEELEIDLGPDQTVDISNISHMASLDAEDFLNFRVFTNNDAANILWEYAFEYVYIGTQHDSYDPDAIRLLVSADTQKIPLQATVVGYAFRDPEIKEALVGRWTLTGTSGATLTRDSELDDDVGVFFNELILPSLPIKGTVANVEFKLNDQPDAVAYLQPIEIIAGAPASISIDIDQNTYSSAGGYGTIELTATVRDQFGNLVEDGTAVDILLGAEGFVEPFDQTQEEYIGLTENGQVKARIRGGYYPGDFDLTVKAGNATQVQAYTIYPLNIAFLNTPSTVAPNTSKIVELEITDFQGNSVEGVDVRVWGLGYIVDDSNTVTNSSGRASFELVAGAFPNVNAEIKAQAAFEMAVAATVPIGFPASQNNFDADNDKIIVVGDQATAGTVQYVRYDEQGFNIPYEVENTTSFTGEDGETLSLELGDLLRPNLDPISSYYIRRVVTNYDEVEDKFYDIVPDESGVVDLVSEKVQVSLNNSPFGNHSNSGYFSGEAKITIPNQERFKPTTPGFTLAFKPNLLSDGTLIENGPLHLIYANNRLQLNINTSNGTESISSDELSELVWHRVGVKYQGSQLFLQVNDNIYGPIAVAGEPVDSSSPNIGENFEGWITHVHLYDYSQDPLLTFDDGTTSKTLNFDTENLTQTVTVKSNAQLNAVSGGSTSLQTVMLNSSTEGQAAIPINVLSTPMYTELAGHYLITAYDGAEVPDINLAVIENPEYAKSSLVNIGFIPAAHAFGWSDLGSGFVSALSTAVSFFLPIYEIKTIYEQVGYLVAGDPDFDPVVLAINTVGILTYIPGIGYLAKPIYKPVQKLFALGRSKPKAMKAVGGSIMKLVTRVKKSKSLDPVLTLLPFLLVAAEMYYESPEAISLMFSSIDTDDDLWGWIDYFNIPDDWNENDEGIPSLELSAYDSQYSNLRETSLLATTSIIPKANAAPRLRANGGAIARALNAAVARLPPDFNKQALSQAIKSTRTLKDTAFRELRRIAKDPKFLASTTALALKNGQKDLTRFLKGASDSRISPILFLAMVAFLEDEALEGRLSPELHGEVAKLYGKVLSSVAYRKPTNQSAIIEFKEENTGSSNNEEDVCERNTLIIPGLTEALDVLNGGGHGAMFHIAVISYYQLITSSAGYVPGDPMYRIKDVEASRRVWLYKDQSQAEEMSGESVDAPLEEKPLLNTLRKVDIVLESTDSDDSSGEIWVELKSYRSSPRDRLKTRVEGLNRWVLNSKESSQKQCRNSSLHKQFIHDRVALQHGSHSTAAANGGASYEPIAVDGLKWWFQKFKVDVKNTRTRNVVRTDTSVDVGSYTVQGNVRNNLTDLPKGKLDTINLNLFGVDDETDRNGSYQNRANISGYDGLHLIDEFSVKSAVLNTMLQSGLLPGNADIIDVINSTMLEP